MITRSTCGRLALREYFEYDVGGWEVVVEMEREEKSQDESGGKWEGGRRRGSQ